MPLRNNTTDNIKGLVPFRDSIAQQLFLVVFAIYLLISLVITFVQISETYNRAQNDVSRELKIFGRSFEGGMAKALWEFDDAGLLSSIQGLIEIPGVLGVKVTNPKGDKMLGAIGSIVNKNGHPLDVDAAGIAKHNMSGGAFSKLFWQEFDVVYKHSGTNEVIAHAAIYSNSEVVLDRIKFSVLVIVLSEIIEVAAL